MIIEKITGTRLALWAKQAVCIELSLSPVSHTLEPRLMSPVNFCERTPLVRFEPTSPLKSFLVVQFLELTFKNYRLQGKFLDLRAVVVHLSFLLGSSSP